MGWARLRNYLFMTALYDEDWVLWIDSDLAWYPRYGTARLQPVHTAQSSRANLVGAQRAASHAGNTVWRHRLSTETHRAWQ